MTKEELEKEVLEYLNTQTLPKIDSLVYRVIKNLIFGFAEPREKRIEELEQENNKLLDVINGQDVKIAELEKENAGLKERLELLNLNANIAVRDLNDLLTKATEIIKSLIALHYNPVVTKDDLKKQDKILEHAEQFLKEIEK